MTRGFLVIQLVRYFDKDKDTWLIQLIDVVLMIKSWWEISDECCGTSFLEGNIKFKLIVPPSYNFSSLWNGSVKDRWILSRQDKYLSKQSSKHQTISSILLPLINQNINSKVLLNKSMWNIDMSCSFGFYCYYYYTTTTYTKGTT